jgi:DNA polymerase III delta prime subunit
MDPKDNPFSPGAGTRPPELAGRDTLMEKARIALSRIKAGRSEKGMLFVGLRGVGKTVLLQRIARDAVEQGYHAASVEAQEGKSLPHLLIPKLRSLTLELARAPRASAFVRRTMTVLNNFSVTFKAGDLEIGVEPCRGLADSGDLESDLSDLLVAVGEGARDRETAVALLVDEMQYLSDRELGALIMAVHRIAQEGLPLAVFGAGLPQLVGKAGKAKSYAERLFDYPELGPLLKEDAEEALQGHC